ncbi:MAG: hypothetical protein HPY61_08045 [Methanotrichaceae archaeon]|nr:hypothetical protein [Methanotrichaceae archaeon]
MNGIDGIAASFRDLLNDRPIIARCELLARSYEFVRSADLSPAERQELEKTAGKDISSGIFRSIMNGEPVFSSLPKIDTYTTLNGRIFHFLHTCEYGRQDFDDAYRKFLQLRPGLKALMRENLAQIMKDFMSEAGYDLTQENLPEMTFEAGSRKIRALIATSVKSLDSEQCKPGSESELVVLVPSGESLEPFMLFFREHGQDLTEAGAQVWIANLEKGTVDPFIGYTTDMDIYEQFNNPRLAEMVRANWTVKS